MNWPKMPRRFEMIAAALGVDLLLYIEGIKAMHIIDSSVRGAGTIRVGAYGNAEVYFEKVELLAPTPDQVRQYVYNER